MRDFYSLTERGQAKRMRGLALKALDVYPLEVARLRLLDASYNCIFRVDTTDGHKYALRICVASKPGEEAAHSLPLEVRWLDALATETDLTVLRPIATRAGSWFVEESHKGIPEARRCVLFSWIPGPDLSERSTELNWQRFGAFAAKLHTHTTTFQLTPTEQSIVRSYDRLFPFADPVVLFDETIQARFSPGLRSYLAQAKERVEAALKRRREQKTPLQLLHADLHHWNVKIYRGRIAAIDFEDLMLGYPAQDIAITMYYMLDHEEYRPLRDAFLAGYTRVATWPALDETEVDTWICGRAMVLLNLLASSPRADYQRALPGLAERCERRFQTLLDA